jgi:hypothetical protein
MQGQSIGQVLVLDAYTGYPTRWPLPTASGSEADEAEAASGCWIWATGAILYHAVAWPVVVAAATSSTEKNLASNAPAIPSIVAIPRVTKSAGSNTAALAMAYKLLATAQERWRRFSGHHLVADDLDGVKFKDGIRVTDDDNHDDGMTDEKVAA